MKTSLVLTLIGLDKPGVVETVSQTVAASGANWEESRMAHLAGRFAGLLLVTVDDARADELEQALQALEQHGLRVVIERATASALSADAQPIALRVEGSDQPGIVRDIAAILARREINVEELETEVISAPMAGHPLFQASASLRVPASVSISSLQEELESLAHDLVVELAREDE